MLKTKQLPNTRKIQHHVIITSSLGEHFNLGVIIMEPQKPAVASTTHNETFINRHTRGQVSDGKWHRATKTNDTKDILIL